MFWGIPTRAPRALRIFAYRAPGNLKFKPSKNRPHAVQFNAIFVKKKFGQNDWKPFEEEKKMY